MTDLKEFINKAQEPIDYIDHIEGLLKKAQSYVEESAALWDDANKLNEEIKECLQ